MPCWYDAARKTGRRYTIMVERDRGDVVLAARRRSPMTSYEGCHEGGLAESLLQTA